DAEDTEVAEDADVERAQGQRQIRATSSDLCALCAYCDLCVLCVILDTEALPSSARGIDPVPAATRPRFSPAPSPHRTLAAALVPRPAGRNARGSTQTDPPQRPGSPTADTPRSPPGRTCDGR